MAKLFNAAGLWISTVKDSGQIFCDSLSMRLNTCPCVPLSLFSESNSKGSLEIESAYIKQQLASTTTQKLHRAPSKVLFLFVQMFDYLVFSASYDRRYKMDPSCVLHNNTGPCNVIYPRS